MVQATDESFRKTTRSKEIFLYTEPPNAYSAYSIWVMFVYSCTAMQALANMVAPTCVTVAEIAWEGGREGGRGGKDGKEGGREEESGRRRMGEEWKRGREEKSKGVGVENRHHTCLQS